MPRQHIKAEAARDSRRLGCEDVGVILTVRVPAWEVEESGRLLAITAQAAQQGHSAGSSAGVAQQGVVSACEQATGGWFL